MGISKGYVVSDSEAVEFISNKHKVADTYEDGIAQAVNAGLNIRTHFTPPADFILPLRKAVDDGKISPGNSRQTGSRDTSYQILARVI